jgi:DNA-binding NarL/FixJ family response regulator
MPRGKRLRLLIIDDSPTIRQTLARVGSYLPRVEVVGEAENGIEGLALIRKLRPNVVTLDIQMPEMGGIEVLKTIKDEGLKCVVIVLSAMADQTYREQCLALGADYVFDKTSEFKQVIEVLRTM